MKGITCCYSGAGNTKLACRYIAGRLGIPFDVVDIVNSREDDLRPYDVVGFATFTDFLAPPYLYQVFVQGLPRPEGKPAFVSNTYGSISGKTLRILKRTVTAKGFVVIVGHSLHTPESYPPMIARGRGAERMPNEKMMRDLDSFISELGQSLTLMQKGQKIGSKRLSIGLMNSMLPALPRTTGHGGKNCRRVIVH